MDIVAHSLWAGLGAVAVSRRWPVSANQVRAAVALAALPDIGHLIPIILWGLLGDGTWAALQGYAFATPGAEPWLPAGVQTWSHTLHCVMHSAIIASVVTAIAWLRWRWALVLRSPPASRSPAAARGARLGAAPQRSRGR